MVAGQVEPGREAVDLERDAVRDRDLVDAVEVEGVLGTAADDAPLRVAEAAHRGMFQRRDHAAGQLLPRHPLPAVDAGLDPVELGQHIVGEVEPAVGQDVALDAAQDAERGEALVRGGDLLALAADVVAGEPPAGPTAGVWSQIARYS